MKTWLAAFALVLSATLVRAEPPPPLEAYGKLPTIESASISPDGGRIALILTDGEKRLVTVMDAATKARIVTLPAGEQKVMGLEWAGPNHVILSVDHDTDALGFLVRKLSVRSGFDIDVAKRVVHPLVDTRKSVLAFSALLGPIMTRRLDDKPVLFFSGLSLFSGGGVTLFKYDPEHASGAGFKSGPPHTFGWLVGADGQPLARELLDEQNYRWTLQTRVGETWSAINQTIDIEYPSLQGLGRTPNTALVYLPADDRERNHDQLVEVAPGQPGFGAPLVDADLEDTIHDRVTQLLIGYVQLIGDERRYTFFDPLDARAWRAIQRAYPGSLVEFSSLSADHKRWVVYVDSPSEGPAFALVDIATGKGAWLGGNYVAASKDLGPKTPIAFKASDGLDLTGYLTLPRDVTPKGLPLVVFPHGGPALRNGPGFDWWAQAMASRGYAVLQVNFRGSSGFGRAFERAGFAEFGKKMQSDLSDGVRYLAAQGTIDPKRVCIVGHSYGGYAALAGAALQKGVYRCAVDVAGVSDPRKVVGTAEERTYSRYRRYWWRYMGGTGDRKALMDAISPVDHADDVSIPVLIIHGKDDTVVDFSQSQTMYDALKKRGKDVQLVVLAHEDQWLLTGATRLQMLQATMDFLLKNNPPG